MKNFLPLLTIALLVTFTACEKNDNDTSALCNNGILDGKETEIDCGGDCTDCPPAATFSCTLGVTPFVSTNATGQILGPSIRINAVDNDGRPMNFMFLPNAVNQPLPLTSAAFSYLGEPYSKGLNDTGSVTITGIDTLRRIISGNFAFSCTRITNNTQNAAKNGAFANVRYK
ncbi:MAG: hypothetical protein KIS94_15240 [Chitinophagales bacterium]|nr:hypothetical protein [Chitinophagales bacterium]